MSHLDMIELRGLRLTALVGVLPEERERVQPIEFDLDLHVDLGPAGASDALTDTVDYGAVCDVVERVCTASSPRLLERLAAAVADELLESDQRISAVRLRVRKLRPPVPHQLDSSGVSIFRERR